ncbi:MAG: OB-fold domain-containing protein [Devosia sp.]|nr:OB-fold domain-containing protein [Devosia sp.]
MVVELEQSAQGARVPIREGLLAGDLANLSSVRLRGTRCLTCHEVSLGHNEVCPNCGGSHVEDMALSDKGTLWTFTVVRNRPPGDYKGADPFVPFGLGLVELPDGLRVLSPIDVDISRMEIGMPLSFSARVSHRDAESRDVVAFTFKSIG